ncbi:MAG: hypothetical protein PHW08_11740, partial [Kiritimatiellae bacterium]|nr:hypothetical protein [Kiritimatiellia bacterium]
MKTMIGAMAMMAMTAMGGDAGLNVASPEAFDPSDAPKSHSFGSLAFQGPWGYDRPENAGRLYPLLVSGFWNEGQDHYAAVAQKHPAFVL